jgi:hypothetical protein
MAGIVRHIVRHSPECKCIFIYVGGIAEECHYKVAAANIMDQAAELLAAEWVITHVLNHAPVRWASRSWSFPIWENVLRAAA